MFLLRAVAHKVGFLSWRMTYDHIGNAIAAAEKSNGAIMEWTYRKATNSYKSHGKTATYYIEPTKKSTEK